MSEITYQLRFKDEHVAAIIEGLGQIAMSNPVATNLLADLDKVRHQAMERRVQGISRLPPKPESKFYNLINYRGAQIGSRHAFSAQQAMDEWNLETDDTDANRIAYGACEHIPREHYP